MTRLRPGVRATPLPGGVHVRAWTGSFTVEGGAGVPVLWGRLEDALRRDELENLLAQAGPNARRVLTRLLDTLDGHGMLVPSPHPGEGRAGDWFAAVAPDPAAGQRAVSDVVFTVSTGPHDADLARAVERSLLRFGASVALAQDPDAPPGQAVLEASGHAVALRVGADLAFVTEPAPSELVRADARALAERLALAPPAKAAATGAMTALVAGAAAQRLVSAVAALPDPATHGENPRLPEDWPSVLVATADPFGAEYHPWRGRVVPAPATLADALRTVEALCDERTGLLPAVRPGALPQLPAALAGSDAPGRALMAAAARVDLARLEAACQAAELQIAETFGGGHAVAVGFDHGHAAGRSLRASALALPLTGLGQVDDGEWNEDQHARYWRHALAGLLGVSVLTRVFAVAEGVYRAEVCLEDDVLGRGDVLGQAIEATPGDAAAFAALAATGVAQSRAAAATAAHLIEHVPPSGALTSFAASGLALAPWESPGSAAAWIADVAGRQADLRDRLVRLVGPVRRWFPWQAGPFWDAGLTVVVPGGEP